MPSHWVKNKGEGGEGRWGREEGKKKHGRGMERGQVCRKTGENEK